MNESHDKKIADFINSNFKIRECVKYRGTNMSICACGKVKDEHPKYEDDLLQEDKKWSYETHTKLKDCDTYGRIRFKGFRNISKRYPSFIRFDPIEDLDTSIKSCYQLLTDLWQMHNPSLIISINGGLKKMRTLTNQQKKNFKQGLIEVLAKDKTWVIAGGFNVGIHKLVSEAIEEFRCYYEGIADQTKLIGICTWGVVKNSEKLLPVHRKDFKVNYPFDIPEKSKVILDQSYDCFLFCDDGTEKKYDKEKEFMLKFQKYLEEKDTVSAFLVQIMFEGGKRSIEKLYKALEQSVGVVIIKGSGRASDLVCEVLDMKMPKEEDINAKMMEYVDQLKLVPDDLKDIFNNLKTIQEKYKKNIIVFDMTNSELKLEKQILEAIVKVIQKASVTEVNLSKANGIDSKEQKENLDKIKYDKLENVLKLAIKFDCPDIAESTVFSDSEFTTIKSYELNDLLIEVLKKNQSHFVELFIDNDVNIEKFINENDQLKNLYRHSFEHCMDSTPNRELIQNILNRKRICFCCNSNSFLKDSHLMIRVGYIVQRLSGNILENPYLQNDLAEKRISIDASKSVEKNQSGLDSATSYSMKDLFLWALITGKPSLARVLWKNGKDQVSTALVAAIILKNMSILYRKRGDTDVMKEMEEESERFQRVACRIISEASRKSKAKTYEILVRSDKSRWDRLTCLQLAINGEMLEFINHSACKSYITQVWMSNKISPFTPKWRILISLILPFCIRNLIFHNSDTDQIEKANMIQINNNIQSEGCPLTEHNISTEVKQSTSSYISAYELWSTPYVKFSFYLICYVIFLMIFSYHNLCCLKPLSDMKTVHDWWPEIFIIIYIFSFILEELRQIGNEHRTKFRYKILSYVSASWNKFDVIIIIFYLCGLALRFTIAKDYFIIVRCFYAISLSSFFLRSMQFFFVSKDIGPKIIMIQYMMKDISFFLNIFGVFLAAYGVLSQSLLRPNSSFDYKLFRDIVYLPYFQTYGELMLDNLEMPDGCTTNRCIIMRTIVIGSFAVFLLFTNVLLINLLIAMFGHTFNTIQVESEKFWSFIHIQLVQEFYNKPILPPPFTILYYIQYLFCKCCNCCKSIFENKHDLLVKRIEEEENSRISVFEQMCTDACVLDSTSKNEDAIKNIVLFNELNQLLDKLDGVSAANTGQQNTNATQNTEMNIKQRENIESMFQRISSTRF